MFNGEVDVLECRLEELSPVVDRFVLVECGETHLGQKKGSDFDAYRSRFDRWRDQIEHVWFESLRSTDPFEREGEHREHARDGLDRSLALGEDIVLYSDVDEIPRRSSIADIFRALSVERPPRLVTLEQVLHYFAVDWVYPGRCEMAPTARKFRDLGTFWQMRRDSAIESRIPNGGWHFSWLGGRAAHERKIESIFEGPQIAPFARPMIEDERNWRDGIHVNGVQMAPVEVDDTWPAYVFERRCPANWFRPRTET